MGEIIRAIVSEIHQHGESAITGVFSILGVLLGLMFTGVSSWFKARGNIVLRSCTISGDIVMSKKAVPTTNRSKDGYDYRFDLDALIANTYSTFKSFSLESVSKSICFFVGKHGKQVPVTFSTTVEMAIDDKIGRDGTIAANGFSRLRIDAIITVDPSCPPELLRDWDHVRIKLLIAPNEVVYLWHKLDLSATT